MMDQMSLGVSVYPNYRNAEELEESREYIRHAAAVGCNEVFSSLHMPENDVGAELDAVAALGHFVHSLNMMFTLDVSGRVLRSFLSEPEKAAKLEQLPLDWLRMDYGFEPREILQIVDRLGLPGVMCKDRKSVV